MARWPYGTRQWRYTRLHKLSASPWCEVCGGVADQVDHVVAVEAGGQPFDQANLQSLCQQCHSSKSAAVDGGFGNKRGKWKPKGCKPDGTPLDPGHEWNRKENLPARDRGDRALPREES